MKREKTGNILKKTFVFSVFLFAIVICALVYWNSHLYYAADGAEESEKKIEILEKAIDFYPSNDLVFYELGKTYFDLGTNTLNNPAQSKEYIQKSIQYLQKSVKSNPASYFSHFYLAQALLYWGYLTPSADVNPYEDFRKAASLAGENSQIFFEVSKIMLSQWSRLSDKDREFTLEILKKVTSRRDRQRILALLHVWQMNVEDYSIIETILPEDSRIFRMYADFLGERSLSVEARKRSLAKAEFLEFERAKEKYREGQKAYYSFRMEEAFGHFQNSLNILRRIGFYQNLSSQVLIDLSEFNNLRKSALLHVMKCLIEQGMSLKDVEDYLVDYLSIERNTADIAELEAYLRERGLIREKFEPRFNNDLDRLYVELLLSASQNRYREIMQVGQSLRQSFVVIPESKKSVYARILNLIGDSYQKIRSFYNAIDFYQRALEIEPTNLETLIRIRRNYERLGKKEETQQIRESIEELIAPKETTFKNRVIKKGHSFSQSWIVDGRQVVAKLYIQSDKDEVAPLISVFFNGHVIWEDYMKEDVLSLSLNTQIGKNVLRIRPLNRDVTLLKMAYRSTAITSSDESIISKFTP